MIALTLWRPWPWAILRTPRGKRKLIENRDWPLPRTLIGQPLGVHAGKKWDSEGAQMIQDVLGLVGLPPEAWDEGLVGQMVVDDVLVEGVNAPPPEQAQWFVGRFGFLLNDEQTFPIVPIPCRGMQKLWTVPEDLVARMVRI